MSALSCIDTTLFVIDRSIDRETGLKNSIYFCAIIVSKILEKKLKVHTNPALLESIEQYKLTMLYKQYFEDVHTTLTSYELKTIASNLSIVAFLFEEINHRCEDNAPDELLIECLKSTVTYLFQINETFLTALEPDYIEEIFQSFTSVYYPNLDCRYVSLTKIKSTVTEFLQAESKSSAQKIVTNLKGNSLEYSTSIKVLLSLVLMRFMPHLEPHILTHEPRKVMVSIT